MGKGGEQIVPKREIKLFFARFAGFFGWELFRLIDHDLRRVVSDFRVAEVHVFKAGYHDTGDE